MSSNKKKELNKFEKAELNGAEKAEKSESNGAKKIKRKRTANPLLKIKVLRVSLEKANKKIIKLTEKRDLLKKQFEETWKEVNEHISVFKEENGDSSSSEFDIDASKIDLNSEVVQQ